MGNRIQTTSLKVFVKRQCSNCPLLQQIILQEPDLMAADEFIIKCKVWLRVMAKEREARESQAVGLLQNRLLVRE